MAASVILCKRSSRKARSWRPRERRSLGVGRDLRGNKGIARRLQRQSRLASTHSLFIGEHAPLQPRAGASLPPRLPHPRFSQARQSPEALLQNIKSHRKLSVRGAARPHLHSHNFSLEAKALQKSEGLTSCAARFCGLLTQLPLLVALRAPPAVSGCCPCRRRPAGRKKRASSSGPPCSDRRSQTPRKGPSKHTARRRR